MKRFSLQSVGSYFNSEWKIYAGVFLLFLYVKFIHLQPSNIEYTSLQKFHEPHINLMLGPIIGDFNVQVNGLVTLLFEFHRTFPISHRQERGSLLQLPN